MTVVDHVGDTTLLATAMALCSDAVLNDDNQAEGEPTECALVNFACSLGLKKQDLEKKTPRVDEAPFDSGRKMMSTVHAVEGGFVQYTKGGPDVVLSRCTAYYEDGQIKPMTEEKRAEILAANKAMADRALRVLAAAKRDWAEKPGDHSPEFLEQDLVFVGLTGMIDPVRPEVKAAIAQCPQRRHPSGDDHRRSQGHRRGHRKGTGHHYRCLSGHHRSGAGPDPGGQAAGDGKKLRRLRPGYSRNTRSRWWGPGRPMTLWWP